MRVTKIGPPTPVYRKALGYDPGTPVGPVEPPEFEGAFVLTPQEDAEAAIIFEPAPSVTDGDVDTYNLTTAHDEAMRIILDFPVRFSGAEIIGAWETAGSKTYTFEGANLPDYSDAVELDSVTFDAFDDWAPVTFTFDYPSPTTGHQFYRLIGPDEERRWHNLRLFEDTRSGCECVEFCRDAPPLALKAAATSPTSANGSPINVGMVPEPGDLWLIWKVGFEQPSGFTQVGPILQPAGDLQWTLWRRECQAGDSGQVTLAVAVQWVTALFEGSSAEPDEVAYLDAQSSAAGTLEVPITVPSGSHLVVAFFAHNNTLVANTAPEAGWTQIEEEHYAGSKVYIGIYDEVAGGAETPGIVITTFAGEWVGIAASFGAPGPAIVGGPGAIAGDGTLAAPCTHHHDYVATGGTTGQVLAKASNEDWDTEWIPAGSTSDLDALTDVTLTSPQADDTLRYVDGVWVNDNRRWEAVTDGEDVFVWETDDLVHEWKEY